MARPAINLDDLSPEEQLQLLEDIWDRLSRHPADIPLSDAQRAELDRRLDALEEDVTAGRALGRPWAEVRERFSATEREAVASELLRRIALSDHAPPSDDQLDATADQVFQVFDQREKSDR